MGQGHVLRLVQQWNVLTKLLTRKRLFHEETPVFHASVLNKRGGGRNSEEGKSLKLGIRVGKTEKKFLEGWEYEFPLEAGNEKGFLTENQTRTRTSHKNLRENEFERHLHKTGTTV